jgi:hypothetical protein
VISFRFSPKEGGLLPPPASCTEHDVDKHIAVLVQVVTIARVHLCPHQSEVLLEQLLTAKEVEDSVLTREKLVAAMEMHVSIDTG